MTKKKVIYAPIQHPTLPPDLVVRMVRLHEVLGDLMDGMNLDRWKEGFQRDMHPENEVIMWEGMARAITKFRAAHTLSIDAQRDLLGLALAGLHPCEHLTPVQASAFLDVHEQAWAEVRRETKFKEKYDQALLDYKDLAEGKRKLRHD